MTGSCGKSTTCQILAQILSNQAPCRIPNLLWNYTGTVPLAILKVTSEDRYVVQEIATHVPGSIERICKMYLPQIGVVMNVGTDHYTQFGSQERIAFEKAALVRALPADGVAVLNADDPRVIAMASVSPACAVTFGIKKEATYRARDVTAAWPQGLSFILEHHGENHRVETGLFGVHFAPNVLASLATAHTAGMPLEDAIAALRESCRWRAG
ncbi:MAG: Mur ligase family protein [Verrucomicrobiales bacterium]